jgi:hypothetical protein
VAAPDGDAHGLDDHDLPALRFPHVKFSVRSV